MIEINLFLIYSAWAIFKWIWKKIEKSVFLYHLRSDSKRIDVRFDIVWKWLNDKEKKWTRDEYEKLREKERHRKWHFYAENSGLDTSALSFHGWHSSLAICMRATWTIRSADNSRISQKQSINLRNYEKMLKRTKGKEGRLLEDETTTKREQRKRWKERMTRK